MCDDTMDVLRKKIDYSALRAIVPGKRGNTLVNKLERYFHNNHVSTNGDLVSHVKEKWVKWKPPASNRIRDPFNEDNLGPRTNAILCTHLQEIGVYIYEDGYRPEELIR
jgi:hypothetical protein